LLGAGALLSCTASNAQIAVTPNLTAADMLDYITGTHVTVSNPVLTCPTDASGTFLVTGTSPLGLDSGIVLTTGSAMTVSGLAGVVAATANGGPGDIDLTATIGAPTYEACRLDFDFESTFDTVLFYYSFASEEYTSYTCSAFNDAFAFYISGPGITGMQNMALVPGTNIPVAINSINSGSASVGGTLSNCTAMGAGAPFSAYFIDNSGGSDLTYDGLTTILEAKYPVTPNVLYHLSMVVGDVMDGALDSGVFIRGSSFTSKPGSTTVSSLGNIGNIPVVPNPFKDKITVQLPKSLNSQNITAYMLNNMGQSVFEYKGLGAGLNTALQNHAASLYSGIYFMNIKVPATGQSQTIRLQKIN
jgi:hypothetical protein